MIEEKALVVKLQGRNAVIEMQRQSACQSCELSGGCGTGSLGRLLGYKPLALSIPNRHKLKVGDKIIIGMLEKYFNIAGFLMYLFPLAFLFAFGLMANYFFNATEWINVLASLFGLASGLLMTARLAKKKFAQNMRPHFIRLEFSISTADLVQKTRVTL